MTQYLLRILLAGTIGVVIGFTITREDRRPSSREFAIIGMGAALITVTSVGLYPTLSLPGVGDPGRMPAQVISALGFLGTGLIGFTKDRKAGRISGAAALWLTAILGMIVGAGLNQVSILGVVFFLLVYGLSCLMPAYRKK